jgi:hypothetical protein
MEELKKLSFENSDYKIWKVRFNSEQSLKNKNKMHIT